MSLEQTADCYCGQHSKLKAKDGRMVCTSCHSVLWQPIDTAPKKPANYNWEEELPSFLVWDGKRIYCADANLYPIDNGCGCCSYEIKATHWMPLPEPPKKGDE